MPRSLDLLAIGINGPDLRLLLERLERQGYSPSCERLEAGELAGSTADPRRWDVAFCAHAPPAADACEALAALRCAGVCALPFVIAHHLDDETVAALFEAGARDVFRWDDVARLGPAVRRELAGAAREAAEAERRRSEKAESLAQLASGIAHDLNNLLTVILGNVRLLQRKVTGDPEITRQLEAVANATKRGAALTQCLLTFGRGGALEPTEEPVPEPAASSQGRTILVVEDEASLRSVVVRLLGDMGFRVLEASNGPDAVDLLAGRPDIDLLFTDVVMPGGMTGFELAAKARALNPAIALLLASGYADAADATMPAGAAILRKPYEVADLERHISAALRERAATQACAGLHTPTTM